MTLPVVLTPLAKADFDAAFDWYEQQRAGLGSLFTARVREVLHRIGATPRMHSVVVADVRKALLRQFPYAVFYRETIDCVLVVSVFHGSRDPTVWQSRITPP